VVCVLVLLSELASSEVFIILVVGSCVRVQVVLIITKLLQPFDFFVCISALVLLRVSRRV
jgi:hypothetical protein